MKFSALFYYLIFAISAIVAFVLLMVGLHMPPKGKIDPSVIQAVGELIGIMALAQIPHVLSIISKGHTVKFSGRNFTVEAKGVNDEAKQ